MADQSTIQQLLQQGVGLQSGAQGNTMTTANNGNPGTIYNVPQNTGPARPAALPPMADAQGNWLMPTIQPQGFDPRLLQLIQGGNNVQQTQVKPVIPAGEFVIPPVIIPGLTPPPAAPPTAPPMSGPTPPVEGGGMTTGGNLPPITSGGASGAGVSRPLVDNFGNVPLGVPPAIGGAPRTDPTGGYGADLTPGGFNWEQLVDVAGDALGLPGNWYLNNTGQWDVSNILTSLGSTVTGLPIGTMLSRLGEAVATGDGDIPLVPKWLENIAVNHYMDNAQNSLTGSFNTAQQNMMNQIATDSDKMVSQTASDAMRKFGLDPTAGQQSFTPGYTAGRTPGSVAGAGSIGGSYIDARGKQQFDTAGQDMFAAMKLAGLMKGTMQTGGDIYGRLYER